MYARGHRAAVAIACAGAFVAFLDTTIVNIAFPDISASFAGSGRDALSWVLDGYFVVIAALLVPAGGLADRFGHRRIFLLGIGGFTAASLLCAAAPTLGLLIAFRVVQGIGAALIAPASLAIVLDSFPPSAARPASASGAPLRPRRPRSARPSAARSWSPPTGASSSSSTCRSARRFSSPVAAGCRSPESPTPVCPTCPAR